MTVAARTPNRIASLDGLRAIAIVLVFLAHGSFSAEAPAWMREAFGHANLGVRIFFVISGFLITHLLLRERARTGRIDLGAFYVRRAYRLLPAAYVYIGIITVAFWHHLGRVDLVTSYLYLANYHDHHAWELGHLWSLGVQEQFYLLWPFALALLFPRRHSVLIATILLAPVFRAGLLFAYSRQLPIQLQGVTFWFPSVADALATGCLLAVIRPTLDRRARILEHRLMLLVPLVTLLLVQWQRLPGRYTAVTYQVLLTPLIHVGIALTLDHCIRRRYWILNTAPVVWCGTVSYSLYLWQQPFLISAAKVSGAPAPWERFPQNFAFAVAFGCLSYYLVERPLLRSRERRLQGRALSAAAPRVAYSEAGDGPRPGTCLEGEPFGVPRSTASPRRISG
jgi:peptidoglycan/LPS O-acetylase OafA/YrhL